MPVALRVALPQARASGHAQKAARLADPGAATIHADVGTRADGPRARRAARLMSTVRALRCAGAADARAIAANAGLVRAHSRTAPSAGRIASLDSARTCALGGSGSAGHARPGQADRRTASARRGTCPRAGFPGIRTTARSSSASPTRASTRARGSAATGWAGVGARITVRGPLRVERRVRGCRPRFRVVVHATGSVDGVVASYAGVAQRGQVADPPDVGARGGEEGTQGDGRSRSHHAPLTPRAAAPGAIARPPDSRGLAGAVKYRMAPAASAAAPSPNATVDTVACEPAALPS